MLGAAWYGCNLWRVIASAYRRMKMEVTRSAKRTIIQDKLQKWECTGAPNITDIDLLELQLADSSAGPQIGLPVSKVYGDLGSDDEHQSNPVRSVSNHKISQIAPITPMTLVSMVFQDKNCQESASISSNADIYTSTTVPVAVKGTISSAAEVILSTTISDIEIVEPHLLPRKQMAKRRDPFRRRLRIADSLNAFPASGTKIPLVYHEHFDFIANCLLREIENHQSPISKVSSPDIDLFLVGSCPADAKPAIVVTCDGDLLSHVEALICAEDVQNQHNLVLYKRSGLSNSRKWQYPKRYIGTGPCYYLYVRAPETPRIKYSGTMFQCHTNFESNTSGTLWCGSKIVQTQTLACATLSCILKIDGDTYGLTAAHSFEASTELTERVQVDHFTLSDCSDGTLLIPDLATYQAKSPDLDWALMKISDSDSVSASGNISRLGSIATSHPQNERDILVLSSILELPLSGVLLGGTTVSGSIASGDNVVYWNVELDHDDGIIFIPLCPR